MSIPLRSLEVDYLEPKELHDPDSEENICPKCLEKIPGQDDECSFCKTEDELEEQIMNEELDQISWGDDLTYGGKI